MKLLALEANARKIKKRFMVEGEEELLSSTRHVFAFLLPLLWISPLTVLFIVAWGAGLAFGLDFLLITIILYAWLLFALVMAMNGFIEWRYNFLVVTTEKLVIVDHRFIFSQIIRPVPLENVATLDSGSQYLGIGNCGYVNLHLSEVKQGTNTELRLDRLPKPDVIAGIIENARTLKSQRLPSDKGTQEQTQKVESIQEKSIRHIPTAAGIPAPPEPPLNVSKESDQDSPPQARTMAPAHHPAEDAASDQEQSAESAFDHGAHHATQQSDILPEGPYRQGMG